MAKIAIVGAGAIGTVIAAWLHSTGRHEVRICTRTPFDDLQVITPEGPLEARLRVHTDPGTVDIVDWVLVATKAYDVESTLPWLRRLTGSTTRIAALQNGVEHLRHFREFSASAGIVPVIVDIPAERTAPGRVHQRRTGGMIVPDGEGGRAYIDIFSGTPFAVTSTSDFQSAAWRKLAINCAGAVNAITLRPAGISRDPAVANLMKDLVSECILVGRAEGAELRDELQDEVVRGYQDGPADAINSIHADRSMNRRTEWDARNGVIVRLGEAHGIPTPLNRFVATILRISESEPVIPAP